LGVIACLPTALLAIGRLVWVRLIRVGLVRSLIGWILRLVLSTRIYPVAGISARCRLIRRVANATPSGGSGQRLGLYLRGRSRWLGIERILGPNEKRWGQETGTENCGGPAKGGSRMMFRI
jgi:hypothetical protein